MDGEKDILTDEDDQADIDDPNHRNTSVYALNLPVG